ncbi:MAG: hypothetical protein ACE5MI_06090 [Acidimicrobiia bacterium]
MKRALLIFAVSFSTVLLAGVAFAHVGGFSPPTDEAALDLGHSEPAEELPDLEVPKEPEPEPAAEEPKAEEPEPEPADEATGEEAHEEYPVEEAIHEEPAEEPAETDVAEHEVWIEVLHPKPEQVVENKYVTFEGHVSADTHVFRGKYEADVKYYPEEGFAVWRLALVLSAGEQRVAFEAVGPNGETATDSVLVIYEGPSEEPKEEPGKYDFTAHQKFGECAETPPYDVFYGTGEPGTTVWVESAFGGGETTIGEKGKWDLKVKFYEAPCNEEIKVVLETSDGDRKEFGFVRVCEEQKKDK